MFILLAASNSAETMGLISIKFSVLDLY